MVIGEVISWFKDLASYLVTQAPYPIRIMFWVIMFLAMSSVINLFFMFGNACTTDGTLYEPDNALDALKIQTKRVGLNNNLNYTLVNSTFDPVDEPSILRQLWESTLFVLNMGGQSCVVDGQVVLNCDSDNPVALQELEYRSAQEAQRYDDYVRANGQLKNDGDALVGVVCENENTQMSFAGINVMNKELWLILTVLLILAPFIKMALEKKK